MKKKFNYYLIVWMVLFVLFNAIVFLVPNETMGVKRFEQATFWVAYVFVVLAFAGDLACGYLVCREQKATVLFLNMPTMCIGYAALIVSAIVGTVFLVLPLIPFWIVAIICMAVLAVYIIAVVKARAAAKIVSTVGEEVKEKTAFILSARVIAQSIANRARTAEAKALTQRVADALKYSDPMSGDGLKLFDEAIDQGLTGLKEAVAQGNEQQIAAQAEALLLDVKDRNEQCKLLK